MKAGTATPTTKDYVRVESARTDSAATWTTWVGPISMESSDPQLIGMATDGITDASVIRRTVPGSAGKGSGGRHGGDGTAGGAKPGAPGTPTPGVCRNTPRDAAGDPEPGGADGHPRRGRRPRGR